MDFNLQLEIYFTKRDWMGEIKCLDTPKWPKQTQNEGLSHTLVT